MFLSCRGFIAWFDREFVVRPLERFRNAAGAGRVVELVALRQVAAQRNDRNSACSNRPLNAGSFCRSTTKPTYKRASALQPINALMTRITSGSSGNNTGQSLVRMVVSPVRRTLALMG